MGRLYYLAYGSNLHPLRLGERTPSARLLGPTRLDGYRLAWHKRGGDGSGKCDLVRTRRQEEVVHAAVFVLHGPERPALDCCEGPGYTAMTLEVRVAGRKLACFCYKADASHIDPRLHPFDWYRELVLLGACYHGFPATYLQTIRETISQPDPVASREQARRQLLTRLRAA